MADYKLWNALKDAKKYRWVELSHSLNNESPYWSGIPEGSVSQRPHAAGSRPGKKAPRRRWPRRRGEHTAAKAP